jgi:hypothetical protein
MFPTLALAAIMLGASPAMTLAQEHQTLSADDIDRELVVRFSRAYGMAIGAVGRHDEANEDAGLEDSHPAGPTRILADPDRLDAGLRNEIYQIVDNNGLSEDQWQGMLAHMEKDPTLRERIESLSTPFRYQ